jgi:leader peptidase (prepilin peptidase) / N-methyltransferase
VSAAFNGMSWSLHQVTALLAAPFVGSFLSVLVVRLPLAEPVVVGRSRCPACGHRLGPLELLPVLSWLLRGGRCHYCRSAISWLYPAMELAAVMVVLWAAVVVDGWLLWVTCLLGWALLALAASDLRDMILPDALTLPLLPAGLAAAAWLDPALLPNHLIGAVAGFAVLYGINAAYRCLRGRDGLGLGDAKLLAAAGAWLGWQALPSVLLIAASTALAGAVAAGLAGHHLTANVALPFGAFLCLAFWVVWLHAPQIAAIALL